jgi:very-short-patch-repair endonuclease
MPHFDVPNRNRKNARRMRRALTEAELKLWNELRAHRLMGLSFRRQMPIAGYIVDFACPTHKLIIEVDGSQHANDGEVVYDDRRTATLETLGWHVLRFWNDDLRNMDDVCTAIIRTLGHPVPPNEVRELKNSTGKPGHA